MTYIPNVESDQRPLPTLQDLLNCNLEYFHFNGKFCDSHCPDNHFVCTRKQDHMGIHVGTFNQNLDKRCKWWW